MKYLFTYVYFYICIFIIIVLNLLFVNIHDCFIKLSLFLSLYLFCNFPFIGEQYGNEDGVLNYFANLMIWGTQIMNMTDTAKEGDMERLLHNCKENIRFFYGHSKQSKYFTEVVNLLLVSNFLVSSQLKVRVLEGAFINTKGGKGNNKEADLVQENSIRNKKDLIRNLGKITLYFTQNP